MASLLSPLYISFLSPVSHTGTRELFALLKQFSPQLKPLDSRRVYVRQYPGMFFIRISSTLLYFHSLFSGRREDSEDAGSLPDRQTVTSVLRFRPTARDNLAEVACEAQHPALTQEPLRATVKMFVQCK